MRSAQRGMSLSGFLLLAIALASILKLTVTIVPPYIDHWAIDKAIKALLKDTNAQTSPADLKKGLGTRFSVNNIRSHSVEDFVYSKDGAVSIVDVDYEVRRNIVANIDVVISFQKTYSSAEIASFK